jgi:hypothetical protein
MRTCITIALVVHQLIVVDAVTAQTVDSSQSVDRSARLVADWQLGTMDRSAPRFSIEGKPLAIDTKYGKALQFDGVGDALFFDWNPLAELSSFTVEIIFRPDGDGPKEQRFLHIGDVRRDRLMVETRVTNDGYWYLDAHLRSGDSAKTLIDSTKRHKTDEWYHVAVVVRNGLMETYVNGSMELRGGIPFSPFEGGQTSVGVRQNKVYWYKGTISRIRIIAGALLPSQFLRFEQQKR